MKYALISTGLVVQAVLALAFIFGLLTGVPLASALMLLFWVVVAISAPVAWFCLRSHEVPT